MVLRSSALVVILASLAPLTAQAQRCDAAALSDSVCDCGCGVTDSACPAGAKFTACVVSHCLAGEVPWEHTPSQCMSSACGDGWKDPAAGEACDDGNALASGGCSADCKAVTPGYVCGEGAAKCQLAPADAGAGEPDAGNDGAPDAGAAAPPDAGQPAADAGSEPDPTPAQSGGCSATPGLSLLAIAALLLRRTRRGLSAAQLQSK